MQKTPMAKVTNTGLWCFLIFCTLLCGSLSVTYIGELFTGTTAHGVAEQLGLITFMLGIVFICGKVMQRQLHDHQALKEIEQEQLILNKAKASGGILTISEVALTCGMRISDSKATFERLSLTGVCQIDVNEKGELCYLFPTFSNKQIDPRLMP